MAVLLSFISRLRFARYLSIATFVLAQVIVIDYQIDDYSNETIKYLITNIVNPNKDWAWYLFFLRSRSLGCFRTWFWHQDMARQNEMRRM